MFKVEIQINATYLLPIQRQNLDTDRLTYKFAVLMLGEFLNENPKLTHLILLVILCVIELIMCQVDSKQVLERRAYLGKRSTSSIETISWLAKNLQVDVE